MRSEVHMRHVAHVTNDINVRLQLTGDVWIMVTQGVRLFVYQLLGDLEVEVLDVVLAVVFAEFMVHPCLCFAVVVVARRQILVPSTHDTIEAVAPGNFVLILALGDVLGCPI
ncbi:hypothetical protein CCHR01_03740 [Colletotrichum chrysophilum]|uniref:Uncharacterized protein n=1 Tax=Colletotrichum chrysophilum TaxID=1836956 RepID=A0AAD9AXK5_9PEZI|nr:hypothetical protein CCHR01_03740 [Colletotrichum chrysophilum]